MIKWLLTGGLIPPILLALGVFFLLYLKGYPFLKPRRMLGALLGGGSKSGISSFRAMMLALAGTLGVGNIVGVANAIAIGGAGAVFWMWVSALVAMILKYAEILLAVAHRRQTANGSLFGGAVYYIRDTLSRVRRHRAAAVLGGVFAILTVIDALSMGCVIQVNAIGQTLERVVGVPPWITGVGLILLTLPLIARGSRGISALTEYLVPIMTLGYIVLSAAVLILRWDVLDDAMVSIFREAFSAGSVAGGAIGFLTSRALRVGTMRGLLSNEAGCGTAPTAHASADAKSPADQGIWGIFEVFADTIVLCTATALVILVSGVSGGEGVLFTLGAYSSVLGGFAEWFLAAAVFCFGYATLICWGGYGLESIRFLSSKKSRHALYLLAFGACVLYGVSFAPEAVWSIADFAISAMTVINLFILLLSRREIRSHTLAWANKKEGARDKI